jgi:hypothetical protein
MVYTLIRVLSKASPTTPYEGWHNERPDVFNLRFFGSVEYFHIPKAERRKLAKKRESDAILLATVKRKKHSDSENLKLARSKSAETPRSTSTTVLISPNKKWDIPCPHGRKAIKSHWAFNIRPGMTEGPQRHKASFVANGFSQ